MHSSNGRESERKRERSAFASGGLLTLVEAFSLIYGGVSGL